MHSIAQRSRCTTLLPALLTALIPACSGVIPNRDTPPTDAANSTDIHDVPSQPITLVCNESNCPPLGIINEPMGEPPFRGVGDPSLEFDENSNTVWLSYSHLEPIGSGASLLFGVSLHLARSDDGGNTFQFVQATAPVTRFTSGTRNLATQHEVSSLAIVGTRTHATWLDYTQEFIAGGRDRREDIVLARRSAESPIGLSTVMSERWLGGNGITNVRFGPSVIPNRTCEVYTEPGLFAQNGNLYLVVNCIGTDLRYSLELFQVATDLTSEGALQWLGTLLTAQDATHFGATSLEQADVALARDGTLLLLVTPVAAPLSCSGPMGHRGCVVLEIESLTDARVHREGGVPRVRATIDGDALSSGPGPGLCTYDRASATGVLLVTTTCGSDGLVFTTRRTGLHP